MKKNVTKTFSIHPDADRLLTMYAQKTMQSRSRAVSMLILEAAEKIGISTESDGAGTPDSGKGREDDGLQK